MSTLCLVSALGSIGYSTLGSCIIGALNSIVTIRYRLAPCLYYVLLPVLSWCIFATSLLLVITGSLDTSTSVENLVRDITLGLWISNLHLTIALLSILDTSWYTWWFLLVP